MRSFTVHVPVAAGSGAPIYERAVFIRDGFYTFAFLFNVVWCLWRGLWLSALAIIVLGVALLAGAHALHLSGDAQFWIVIVLALLLGLEASSLLRFRLRRRGYLDAGGVAADTIDDAEAIFYGRVADEMGDWGRVAPGVPSGSRPGRDSAGEDVVGLFPEYRGR
jgi:hypothetical protein